MEDGDARAGFPSKKARVTPGAAHADASQNEAPTVAAAVDAAARAATAALLSCPSLGLSRAVDMEELHLRLRGAVERIATGEPAANGRAADDDSLGHGVTLAFAYGHKMHVSDEDAELIFDEMPGFRDLVCGHTHIGGRRPRADWDMNIPEKFSCDATDFHTILTVVKGTQRFGGYTKFRQDCALHLADKLGGCPRLDEFMQRQAEREERELSSRDPGLAASSPQEDLVQKFEWADADKPTPPGKGWVKVWDQMGHCYRRRLRVGA